MQTQHNERSLQFQAPTTNNRTLIYSEAQLLKNQGVQWAMKFPWAKSIIDEANNMH
jgi:hypothetical protein